MFYGSYFVEERWSSTLLHNCKTLSVFSFRMIDHPNSHCGYGYFPLKIHFWIVTLCTLTFTKIKVNTVTVKSLPPCLPPTSANQLSSLEATLIIFLCIFPEVCSAYDYVCAYGPFPPMPTAASECLGFFHVTVCLGANSH